MGKYSLKPFVAVLLTSLGIGLWCGSAYADRTQVVESLRHSEAQVRSARARVDVRYVPTDPSLVGVIEAENHRINEPEGSYILSPEDASRVSYSALWSRKGSMERIETGALEDLSAIQSQIIFDGERIRTLTPPSEPGELSRETIESPEAAHWHTMNRPYPFGFLFEQQTRSYSDLIERSPVYAEEIVNLHGQSHTRVRFAHPDIDRLEFDLTFDAEGRLVHRVKWKQLKWRKDDRLKQIELHEFSNFQLHTLDSGETLWFPHTAVYTSYTGVTDEGQPIEFMKKIITVEDLEFNIEIPSEQFAIDVTDESRNN